MIHIFAQGTKILLGFAIAIFVSTLPADCVLAESEPSVVATTSIIGDITTRLAGDTLDVSALMGEGIDPHLYKASPGDMRRLSQASLILHNGLHLEGKMAEVLEKLGERKPSIAVTSKIDRKLLRQPPEFAGNYDPHVWFDIRLWILAAEEIAHALSTLAPAHASLYTTRLDILRGELKELHSWVQAQIGSIPKEQRVLVTAHDAFGYFGQAYGIEVLAIQGMSTDSEASLQDINHLVDTLVTRKIPAVFVESSVPQKTIQALVEGSRSRGHDVVVGGELYSDALGAANTPEGTYIGMMKHNVSTIVAALKSR
jgi:manganese/zinc/iron transport system substrate-binding protein